MIAPSLQPNSGSPETRERREALRRGLARSRLATGVTLLLASIMAVVGVYHAFRTEESLAVAKEAKEETEHQLARALLIQARAERHARQPGARTRALDAIAKAAGMAPSQELRDEAAACLALDDLVDEGNPWPLKGCDFDASCLSPKLDYFAAVFREGVILYDTRSREKILRWRIDQEVVCARISDDLRYLAARTYDGKVLVYDRELDKEIFNETPEKNKSTSYRRTLAFRPGKSQLAYSDAGSNRLCLLDLTRITEKKTFDISNPWCVTWNPKGDYVAAISGSHHVIAFHADSGTRSEGPPAEGLEKGDYLTALAWHPDGLHIAAGTRHGWIVIGSTVIAKQRIVRAHSSLITNLAFHPNGLTLASTSWDKRTTLTDPYLCQVKLQTFGGAVFQYSQDGTRLALHQNEKFLSFWQVVQSDTLQHIPTPFAVLQHGNNIDFSPDGRWVAVSDEGGLMIWNLKTRMIQSIAPGYFSGVGFTDDSKSLVAVSNSSFATYPIDDNGDLGKASIIPGSGGYSFQLGTVVRASDGYLLTAKGEGVGIAVTLDHSPKVKHLVKGLQSWPSGDFYISPDNRWGLSCRRNKGGAIVIDLKTKQKVASLSPDVLTGTGDPSGRWFLTMDNEEVQFWEIDSWKKLFTLPRGKAEGHIGKMNFTHDGEIFAISDFDHSVALYNSDQPTKKSITLHTPGTSSVLNLGFSRNHQSLAVMSYAGQAEIWHLDALQQGLDNLGLGNNSTHAKSYAAISTPWYRSRAAAVSLATLGIIAALISGIITSRHQRRLIVGYLQSEALADAQQIDLDKTRTGLIQAQKMRSLGTLSAGVAHDFRNLLSVIRMANGFLKRDPAIQENDDLAEETEAITQAVNKGDTVVRSMLGYSRSDEDKSGVSDLPSVIEEMVSMLGQRFLSGLRVTVEITPLPLHVWISKSQIEQILLNLLVNASEAMGERGELRISLTGSTNTPPSDLTLAPEDCSQYAIIKIEDSGPGLDPELLPHIFEPFFTTKHSGDNPGTGLGLFTIYTIAEKNGVGIGVENLPERGASFSLWVPAHPQEFSS